jgi:hypothetical protein
VLMSLSCGAPPCPPPDLSTIATHARRAPSPCSILSQTIVASLVSIRLLLHAALRFENEEGVTGNKLTCVACAQPPPPLCAC